MSYITDRCIENDLSLVRLQDTATGTIITVLPSYGALLHSFIIPIKGGSINIIDNYPGKDEIDKSLRLTYKGSKLSPFVCRIPEGKYYLRDKEYEITHKFFDGSAIHGLLFNKAFSITDQFADDELASVVLRYHYKKEDPGYPFDYVCEIRYILHPRNSLQVETTILNLDDVSIPVADGWHPYFRLGNLIDDYTLHFASQNMLEFNDKLIPTGKLIHDPAFIHPAAIGNREIDNCFLLEPSDGAPCCILHNPRNGLSLSFFTNASYPYLQIYTPDHRKSIAIENLSGAPDCFNNGIGLKMLAPRHSHTFNVWYQLSLT